MRQRLYTGLFFLLLWQGLSAQNTYRCVVIDSATHELLTGVTLAIDKTTNGAGTNEKGQGTLTNIGDGKQTIVFTYIGYSPIKLTVVFPLQEGTKSDTIRLVAEEADLEEVVISSTRNNSRIENTAVRIDVLGADEMNEENQIKPGSIASLLGDIAGVQMQNTSPSTGNTELRLAGLNGKYTQILRDGIPLYDGYSGGFGIMQIPPMDLKQIELIKGSSSTLYGGGSIAGLVNIISKSPTDKPELSMTVSQSSLLETNANLYYAQKFKKNGVSLFAGGNYQYQRDVNKDGFSDVPTIQSLLVHPRYFHYFKKGTFALGYSGTLENRKGGDMQVLKGKADSLHQYFNLVQTQRHTVDWISDFDLGKKVSLQFKGAASYLNKKIAQNGFNFPANQLSQFAELSVRYEHKMGSLIGGINLQASQFLQPAHDSVFYSYHKTVAGVFVQENFTPVAWFTTQLGLRNDYSIERGNFLLPQVALLFKPLKVLTLRAGGGTGYRVPDYFQDAVGVDEIKSVRYIANTATPEKSYGGNADVNYKLFTKGGFNATLNEAVIYTYILHPVYTNRNNGVYTMYNSTVPIQSLSAETYLRFGYKDLEIYLGYNYTSTKQNNIQLALVPLHKGAGIITYEIEHKWRFGVESSYIGNQTLSNGTRVNGYFFLAAMVEKKFKWGSLVLNGENLTDVRQNKRDNLWTGSVSNPVFKEVYTPIDGVVVNLSLRYNFK